MLQDAYGVVRRRVVSPVGEQVAGKCAHQVIQLGICRSPVVVVVAEADSKRQAPSGNMGEQVQVGSIGRCAIDQIARDCDEVGLFEIQQLVHPFKHYVAAAVFVDIMQVSELQDFELSVRVEAKLNAFGLACAGTQGAGRDGQG